MGVYFKCYEVSPWDITKSYPIGSVVKFDGREYLAKKDVPVGVNIGMSDYWDFGDDERLDNLEEAFEELDGAIQNLELDSLTDVNITNVQDGQLLVYNGETEQFENNTVSAGSIDLTNVVTEVGTFDNHKLYRITLSGTKESVATNTPTSILDVSTLNVIKIVSADGFGLVQSHDTQSVYRYASTSGPFYISAIPNNDFSKITDFAIVQQYTNPADIYYVATIYFICEESEE